MGTNRCAAPGCGRFISGGDRWCRRHLDAGEPAVDGGEEMTANVGDLRGLPGRAPESQPQPAVSDVIAVLRMVLARLMAEETDPARLATNVARVASVVVQASREQRAATSGNDGSLADALRAAIAAEGGAGHG